MSSIPFDPQDPFPLRPFEGARYAAAKEHAKIVDAWLGLRTAETESVLTNPATDHGQSWRGLPIATLLTPYVELRGILRTLDLRPEETIADLGCAYARMAHVLHRHHPGVHYIGLEIEEARVEEARRIVAHQGLARTRIDVADLRATPPPPADAYFIYDFGDAPAIEKVLGDLRERALSCRFRVVARGRSTRHQIHASHPWLAEVNEAFHSEHFSIYRA